MGTQESSQQLGSEELERERLLDMVAHAVTNAQGAEQTAREEAARRAAGRYTLREAAKEIARNGRGDWCDVLRELKTAWAAGKLAAFRPGSELQCELGDASARLHPDYLEAYWGDLNNWLAENQSRIAWQFPKPDATVPDELHALAGGAQPSAAVASTVTDGGDSDAGITRREQQIRAIEAIADRLEYPRQQIPTGGKKKIRERCLAEHSGLFSSEHQFEHAWKAASPNRISMAKRAQYARR